MFLDLKNSKLKNDYTHTHAHTHEILDVRGRIGVESLWNKVTQIQATPSSQGE
jgi:hypothetical protein